MKSCVSIIIPVYNVEKYLAACLDSVLGQTLKDIEAVCVNDCSPDASQQILESFARRDDRVKVFRHERNSGLAAARNTGLENCGGEYVFFLDSDDLLFAEDSLAHLYSMAGKDGADEAIGAMLRWDEVTGERRYRYHAACLQREVRGELFRDNQHLRSNVTACNKLLRRSFLDGNNLRFNSGLKKFEDSTFSWRVHLLARSISLTLHPTYLHRQRSGEGPRSISQVRGHDVHNHILAAEDMLAFLEGNPRFSDLRHNFDRFFFYWLQADARQLAGRSPDFAQKKELVQSYLRLFNRIPHSSMTRLPEFAQDVFAMMQNGGIESAWDALAASQKSHGARDRNAPRRRLRQQLDTLQGSRSWRLTSPLRKIVRRIKGGG